MGEGPVGETRRGGLGLGSRLRARRQRLLHLTRDELADDLVDEELEHSLVDDAVVFDQGRN